MDKNTPKNPKPKPNPISLGTKIIQGQKVPPIQKSKDPKWIRKK